jgi:hypothetical protein
VRLLRPGFARQLAAEAAREVLAHQVSDQGQLLEGQAGLIAAFAFRVQQASDEAKDHIEQWVDRPSAEYDHDSHRCHPIPR